MLYGLKVFVVLYSWLLSDTFESLND